MPKDEDVPRNKDYQKTKNKPSKSYNPKHKSKLVISNIGKAVDSMVEKK